MSVCCTAGPNVQSRAMDGLMSHGIVSSCQSAATSETGLESTHFSSAIYSKYPDVYLCCGWESYKSNSLRSNVDTAEILAIKEVLQETIMKLYCHTTHNISFNTATLSYLLVSVLVASWTCTCHSVTQH